MASSLRTKIRIAASVLFATGFWDAIAGRFLFQPRAQNRDGASSTRALPLWDFRDLRGALHVHSTYSDGAGDVPTVMEAARVAGVDFLLLCDHNTQQPLRDGWEATYSQKPLLLIGTEVTVKYGAFLLALDMPPEWEPKKGKQPQVAIDAIRAQDGLPLVSLPFDIKHPWRDWEATGYEGLEVINFSTIARRHINLLSLCWLLPLYWARGMQAVLGALVTRPDQALARWDKITESGIRSVGIGALDAHALMKIGRRKYPIPTYEDSFRAVMTHVLLPEETDISKEESSTGGVERAAIYGALREGRCYFSYDCLADPTGNVQFFASTAPGTIEAVMGERIPRRVGDAIDTEGGAVTLTALAAPDTLLRLFHRGEVVAAGRDGRLVYKAHLPGAYRIEGSLYARRIGHFYFGARPLFYTNPIYVD